MDWTTLTASLTDFLAGASDDPAAIRLLVLFGIGLLAFTLVILIKALVQRLFNPVRERVDRMTNARLRKKSRSEQFVAKIGNEVAPRNPQKRSKTQDRLIQTGFRSANALAIFYALKLLVSAFLIIFTALLCWFVLRLPPIQCLLYSAILGLIGFLLPTYVLIRLQRRRQFRVRRALPDALDMLVVCAEAGLGLNTAIDRVGRELELQHAELAGELNLVTSEMRAGLDTSTAMRGLVQRTGVDDMKSLVATLLQAMRLGTGIAETLRIYAEELRDKRLQAVEEQAAKLEVKMLLPIAALIMPAFMLVALGPAVLSMAKALKQMAGN